MKILYQETVPEKLIPILAKLNIKVNMVSLLESNNDPASILYTVGLTKHKHPEIIIYNMLPQIAGSILSFMAEFMIDGQEIELNKPGLILQKDVMPCTLIPVTKANAKKYMKKARKRFNNFKAIQYIWCDENKNFPWDDSWQGNFDIKKQRILGE